MTSATKKSLKKRSFPSTLLPGVLDAARAFLQDQQNVVTPAGCESKETMLSVVEDSASKIRDVVDKEKTLAGEYEDNAYADSFVHAGKAEVLNELEARLYDVAHRVESLPYDAVPADIVHRFVSTVADAIRVMQWRGWRKGSFDSFAEVPGGLAVFVLDPAQRMVENVERAMAAATLKCSSVPVWLVMSPKDRSAAVVNRMVSVDVATSSWLGKIIDDCQTSLTGQQVRAIGDAISVSSSEADAKVWLGPDDALARQYVRLICNASPGDDGTFARIVVKGGVASVTFYLQHANPRPGRGWALTVPGRVLFVVAQCAARG